MQWWMLAGVLTVMALAAAFIATQALTQSPALRARTNESGWKVECPACRAISPAGDAGMIRITAASKGKRTLLRCPACATRSMMRVFKDAGAR